MAAEKDLEKLRARLAEAPQLSVVSDGAIGTTGEGAPLDDDSFELSLRIGPIYDIVRHEDTETPMAVAIYGDWGAGKTSAMRWLEGRLRDWNGQRGPVGKICVWPVWFYPWKYQSREDVWRGLIAEVIISYLTERRSVAKSIVEEAKDLGVFLGKSFADMLSGLKVEAGGSAGKVTFDAKVLKDSVATTKDYLRPAAGHLNEFESALRKWVKKALPDHDRMVIFIDDLDRCMPDIALSVLEALKLYLDIDRLIFVVGVDKPVVDQLVERHYENLGVSAEKSANYLAKMFQIEANIAPTDTQVGEFLDEVVKGNEVWDGLAVHERRIFRDVILNLAPHSPREIKRLVNSALIAGVGADMSSLAWGPSRVPVRVAQGIQVFFVRRILEARYGSGLVVSQSRGTEFFRAWSGVVISLPEIEAGHLDLPPGVLEVLASRRDEGIPPLDREEHLSQALAGWNPPETFAPLIEPAFRPYLEFLQDQDLGRLMRIDYPEEAAAVGGEASLRAHEIIREVIMGRYGFDLNEISDGDRIKITVLDFSGYSELDNVASLAGLNELKLLNLEGAKVIDLRPITDLTKLEWLNLGRTEVRDLAPIAGLVALRSLNLSDTKVSDIAPLFKLGALEALHIQRTMVHNIRPLSDLNSLTELGLNGSRVRNLESLQKLSKLTRLSLETGQIIDAEIRTLRESHPNIEIKFVNPID